MSQNDFIKHTATIAVYSGTWLMLERICEREMRRPGPQLSWYLDLMSGKGRPMHNLPGFHAGSEDPFWKEEYRLQKIEHQLYKLFCEDIRPAPSGIIPFPDKPERDRILVLPRR